jgi:hypothetical protein
LKAKILLTCYLLITILVSQFLFAKTALAGGKVSSSPSSVTINEGDSQNVTIKLDAPIICPDPGTCDVSLSFNSSDAQVSATPYPIVYLAPEWTQFRTLTIHTTTNGIYTGNKNVTLTATTVSNSVYYNGFVITIPVTLVDVDPPPAPGITNKTTTVISDGRSASVDVLTGVSGNPDPTSLAILSGPSHGTASVGPTNNITYTPTIGYGGSDSLLYKVCSSNDASVCSTATLYFDVIAAPTLAPTGQNINVLFMIDVIILTSALGLCFVGAKKYKYK